MSNVVTIKKKTEPFDYSKSQRIEGLPEPLVFFGGVILWLILPKFAYIQSGGPISWREFAILAAASILIGVTSYLYPEPGPPSIIGSGSLQQSPITFEPTQRKAA